MALPGLEFNEYRDKRAPAYAVAKYYLEYIKKHDLTSYMSSQSTVTMIQPLTCKVSCLVIYFVFVVIYFSIYLFIIVFGKLKL